MKSRIAIGLVAAALMLPAAANAATVIVSGFSGPWDPTVAGNLNYSTDNAAPTLLNVTAGNSVSVQYLSGLTSAFFGAIPTADAEGYVGGVFGTGLGFDPHGSSGALLPSYLITGDLGTPIYLAALIGAFLDSNGAVIGTPFAPGDGLFTTVAPTGAVKLALGINDDIFGDNAGSLTVSVTGDGVSAAVPEPATWALFLLGFGAIGFSMRRKQQAALAV